MRQKKHRVVYRKAEAGATLIIALVLLLILAVMATTSLQSNALQARMAGNLQDKTQAFEAAEIGLLEAEEWLSKKTHRPNIIAYSAWSENTSARVFDSRRSDDLEKDLASVLGVKQWQQRAQNHSDYSDKPIQGLAENIQFSVELVAAQSDSMDLGFGYSASGSRDRYRQLSRSTGLSGNSEVILETEYLKRFR